MSSVADSAGFHGRMVQLPDLLRVYGGRGAVLSCHARARAATEAVGCICLREWLEFCVHAFGGSVPVLVCHAYVVMAKTSKACALSEVLGAEVQRAKAQFHVPIKHSWRVRETLVYFRFGS